MITATPHIKKHVIRAYALKISKENYDNKYTRVGDDFFIKVNTEVDLKLRELLTEPTDEPSKPLTKFMTTGAQQQLKKAFSMQQSRLENHIAGFIERHMSELRTGKTI